MKEQTNELKPCPFCGSEATLDYYGRYVSCTNRNGRCEVRPHTNAFKTSEDAIKDWNRRAYE